MFGFAVFGHGGVADFALADEKKLCRKPPSLPWLSAGSFATTFLTGYQCLHEYGRLSAGGQVLILGASGGCGTAGIQLAKAIGASEVVAVCSASNAELCTQLGADRVVDYRDAAAFRSMKADSRFDVIYDCASGSGAGEDYSSDASAMLKPGGVVVAINGGLGSWLRMLFKLQSSNRKMMLTRQNGDQLETILSLLGERAASAVTIDSTHPLSSEGVNAAFARLKSRRAKGKVVFDVGIGDEGEPADAPEAAYRDRLRDRHVRF